MTNEISRGLYQQPPPIEVDYDELLEQWRNMSEEEKLANAAHYIQWIYAGWVVRYRPNDDS